MTGVKQSQLLVLRLSLEFGKKNFGKHRLCAIIRFLVFSDIADFGGVLLVLLVPWVIRTPNTLNSSKIPGVVYVSNFSLLALPLLMDLGEGLFFFFLLL